MQTNTSSPLKDTMLAGAVASLTSTAVLMLAGRRQTGSPYAPTNAISHWIWGAPAIRRNRLSWRHTALGYGIHHASSMLWAGLYALWQARRHDQDVVPLLGTAAAVSALAAVVDLRVAPQRLHPGFEQRLSNGALAATYIAFGIGLALPYLVQRR